MRLTAAITHEAPWYVARCLEVEVASQGETVEEALGNLREALELLAPCPGPRRREAWAHAAMSTDAMIGGSARSGTGASSK